MRFLSFLPKDRNDPKHGVFIALAVGGTLLHHPVRCRGEADNASAAAHDNPSEDPVHPYGDHPAGVYRVTEVVPIPLEQQPTFGPYFIALDPLEGEALEAKHAGRTGLGIHGGTPGAVGTVNEWRATYGCLRVSNVAIVWIASLAQLALSKGYSAMYECFVIDEEHDGR